MNKLIHLITRSDWEAAQAIGEYRPSSLEKEGFIHCSKPEQVHAVVQRYYRDVPGLMLLWIDPQRLKAEVRWEESHGEVFPHIYGALNLDAVVGFQAYDAESGERTYSGL